jgi:glycosyltransferase involved in cell wall biosynthesis
MARRLGIPYLMSAHGSLPLLVERKAAKRVFDTLLGTRLVRGAHRMIAVSELEVEQYLAAGINKERISLVHNGLDLSEFADLPPRGRFRQHLDLPDDAALVLFLGRLHPIKGVDHLIAAFAKLQGALKNAHLVIAGPDDGDLARLKGIVKEADLVQSVSFPGGLYGVAKLAAMVDADLVVAPSQYEIFGLVPFEALMCGAPVVVTAGSASGQLLEQAGAGCVAPYGDVETLADAMLEALANPTEARRRVASGQAFVWARLQWGNIARELETLYAAEMAPPAAASSPTRPLEPAVRSAESPQGLRR